MDADYRIVRTDDGTELRASADVLLADGSTGRAEYTAEVWNEAGERIWQADPAPF